MGVLANCYQEQCKNEMWSKVKKSCISFGGEGRFNYKKILYQDCVK